MLTMKCDMAGGAAVLAAAATIAALKLPVHLVAAIGLVVIAVCYIGVNLLGIGLHSYGWFFND